MPLRALDFESSASAISPLRRRKSGYKKPKVDVFGKYYPASDQN